jgi:multicomponent K+:H+ antiporter subunit D
LAVLAGFAAFAGQAATYFDATSDQLFDRGGYIAAVLQPGGNS